MFTITKITWKFPQYYFLGLFKFSYSSYKALQENKNQTCKYLVLKKEQSEAVIGEKTLIEYI